MITNNGGKTRLFQVYRVPVLRIGRATTLRTILYFIVHASFGSKLGVELLSYLLSPFPLSYPSIR